jgi:hypothetical protein
MQIDRSSYRSPNFDNRPGGIEGICLHTTEGNFPHDAGWLCNPQSRVSAHYVIDRVGGMYCLVDDHHRAWHAGHTWGNDHTIGIEISHKRGQDYPPNQLVALRFLTLKLIKEYNISADGIVAHRWLTPYRKTDPTDWSDAGIHDWIASLYDKASEKAPAEPARVDGWHRTIWPATIRTGPEVTDDNIVATFPPDTYIKVQWVQGEWVRESDAWAHLSESQIGFAHSSALESVEADASVACNL